MIYAVFDTNILLQSILKEGGPSDACVKMAFTSQVKLVTSHSVVKELETVINRPNLLSKYANLRTDRPQHLIGKIYAEALFLEPSKRHFRLERDRNDEIFLNLAIESRADFLVSRDRDLLDLRDDSEFSYQFPKLRIVTPVGFLENVRAT